LSLCTRAFFKVGLGELQAAPQPAPPRPRVAAAIARSRAYLRKRNTGSGL
jgi:hypothetical protein